MRAIKTQWFNILKSVVLVRVVENMSRGIGLGFHTFLHHLPALRPQTSSFSSLDSSFFTYGGKNVQSK